MNTYIYLLSSECSPLGILSHFIQIIWIICSRTQRQS